ncbi:alpha/beta hydrolase [Prosthecobacter sp.]|uniref:alpha/beta hydrolase n=1 Tax=Prosthecobacter sp. TaxID=1965333 RepID=UPI0037833CAA
MPKYWMISNRLFRQGQPTHELGKLSYWITDDDHADTIDKWTSVSGAVFETQLKQAAQAFPLVSQATAAAFAAASGQPAEAMPILNQLAAHQEQKHVGFFVHGYNNGFTDAAQRYQQLTRDIYAGPDGLGLCISFDWPSLGSILGYLPDREHAQACASDFTDILGRLHDWLLLKQKAAQEDPADACRAKISIIAHSMGNFLLHRAMGAGWKRQNQPLSVSLVNQLLMVAADVDNDLFEPDGQDSTDGTAVANITYRVTAMYTGRDTVLGASSGLKHFGTRRLGRSGLALSPPTDSVSGRVDNVWDVDCSTFFPVQYDNIPFINGIPIHGAYFITPEVVSLMKEILKGTDRSVLQSRGLLTGKAWPV